MWTRPSRLCPVRNYKWTIIYYWLLINNYKFNQRAIELTPPLSCGRHLHVRAQPEGQVLRLQRRISRWFCNLSRDTFLSPACKDTHVLIWRILLSLDLIFRQWDPVCKQGNRNSGGSSWDNRGYYRFVQQVLYMMPIRLVEVEIESQVCYIPVWSECGNVWHLFHRNLVTDNNGQFPEQDEVMWSILQKLNWPRTRTKGKCIT